MIDALKKIWRYARKYKKLIIISLVMMFIFQALNFISPLIVKNILDDKLLGIENPWYLVEEKSDNTVLYNGNYYTQDKVNAVKEVSIFIDKATYYFIDEKIENGTTKIENGIMTVTNGDNVYQYTPIKLSVKEVKNFYQPKINPLIFLIVALLLKSVVAVIANFIQKFATADLNVNIVRDARLDAVKSLERLPISYFESEPAGKISSRVIHDVNGMINLVSTVMNLVINAGLSFILAYVGMFILDYRLALLSFLIYPLVILWVKVFSKLLRRIAKKVSELNSLIVAQMNEIINGIQILQIFNYHKQTAKDFDKINNEFRKENVNEIKIHMTLGWNLINVARGIVTAFIILYFGLKQLQFGSLLITAGLIYAYNEYLLKIIDPIGMLFRQVSMLEYSIVRTERIFKIIDGEFEDPEYYEIDRFKGDIDFKDVYFSYNDKDMVLKDINLHIKAGEMVGIVGHTGSGKSTMMSLLLRFYDLKEDCGKILVDNKDINSYTKRSYRKHVGIILQDPVLFKGTILSNIQFGDDEITEKMAEEVLIQIGGKKILDKFDKGIYQDVTRGGANLSLGEKQLISFARAMVYNPAILVMDEATANIDTETEDMINHALKVVSENRTTIVIAHRLSTIRNADKIVVLENGLKVEEGKHLELIEKNGVYANIYRSQVSI